MAAVAGKCNPVMVLPVFAERANGEVAARWAEGGDRYPSTTRYAGGPPPPLGFAKAGRIKNYRKLSA